MRKSAGKRAGTGNMKRLIPAGKKTLHSMGLVSFDPEGMFCFETNRWFMVYEAPKEMSGTLAGISPKLCGRLRITMHWGDLGGRETCHLSLMENAEDPAEAESLFAEDEAVLLSMCVIRRMSVDEVMTETTANFHNKTRFSYASAVRGRKDWEKECFAAVKEETDYFVSGRNYGESFLILSYPSKGGAEFISTLRKLGCEIFLGIDLYALNGEEQADFDRTLEKHYNRRIPAREAGENVNLSMGIAVVCDSLDAVRIVEQTLSAVAARNGFLLTPAYGMQKKYYYSLSSFGMEDAKIMRNTDAGTVMQMLGGEAYEDAAFEV